MGNEILLDTYILIYAYRKDQEAIEFLSKRKYIHVISDITIMEILAGCNTVAKRNDFKK